MRKLVLGLMLVSVAAMPAHAERFAISCSGKSINGMQRPGEPVQAMTSPTKIKDIVYVVDEEAQTVQRYIAPGRPLDGVCQIEGVTCAATFSADRITIRGSGMEKGYRTTVSFDWDRRTNLLQTENGVSGANGAGMVMIWSLKCAPAAMPVIDAPAAQ